MITLVLPFLFHSGILAQQRSAIESILCFSGASSVEDMDPSEVERLEDMMRNPIKINLLSVSRLEESGLFTHYQAVSFIDYRTRHGKVMSLAELAAVDGFNEEFVDRLSPFISLAAVYDTTHGTYVKNELVAKSGFSLKGIGSGSVANSLDYGLKYRLNIRERISLGLAVSNSSNEASMTPDAIAGHVSMRFRRVQGKIIVGDYNARFGQGLALWNGMSMSGIVFPSSLLKRTSGLSPSSSFTGNHAFRGTAFDLTFRNIHISSMLALKGSDRRLSMMPAFNVAWLGRHGQASLTHYTDFILVKDGVTIPDMKTAADFVFCVDGNDMFGELSYDWISGTAAMLAGYVFPVGENTHMAAMLRFYPSEYTPSHSAAVRSTTKCSNEYAASFGVESGLWKCSADAAYFPVPKSDDGLRKSMQVRLLAEWAALNTDSFRMKLRLSERIRTWEEPFRTEIRTDMTYVTGRFVVNARFDAVKCEGVGLLGYVEGAYTGSKLSLFLKQGVFKADKWTDRIYSYERDLAGTFNVPAFYGRGIWTSLYAKWRAMPRLSICGRCSCTSYLFMKEFKPGKAELKFQISWDF